MVEAPQRWIYSWAFAGELGMMIDYYAGFSSPYIHVDNVRGMLNQYGIRRP